MLEPLRLIRHNNAPVHAALSVQKFVAARTMTVVPSSPDLAACDFFWFPRLESRLRISIFQDVPEIQ
jgi:hypothetical protein